MARKSKNPKRLGKIYICKERRPNDWKRSHSSAEEMAGKGKLGKNAKPHPTGSRIKLLERRNDYEAAQLGEKD